MRSILIFSATLIFALGLVMIFSTTSAEILDHDLNKSPYQDLVKQCLYAVVGIGGALTLWKAGYQWLLSWSPFLLVFFSIVLALTLIPGIGREVNGSRRWIGLAGFYFQPSEFVKLIVPAYFIYKILPYQETGLTFFRFCTIVARASVPMFLVLVEPNNGTAAVIGMTLVLGCFLTRIPFKFWALPLSICLCIGAVFAWNVPYVMARLNVYLHPELDLLGKGHQPHQAKIAAGSGQLFGKGPGHSLQKLSYLPEAQNDYIAAIYAEEFGFVGIATLILLYMGVACVGFLIASQAADLPGFYIGCVATFLICFQAFLNLGVVSGLLPSTGLNLPLFSQGGTSLIANMMWIGTLLSVTHEEHAPHFA